MEAKVYPCVPCGEGKELDTIHRGPHPSNTHTCHSLCTHVTSAFCSTHSSEAVLVGKLWDRGEEEKPGQGPHDPTRMCWRCRNKSLHH